MTRRAVVLFARTPEGEAMAKRLPPAAAAVFERFIAAWLRTAEATGATPTIACDAEARRRLSQIAPEIARNYVTQSGATFGERLANVAEATARAGFGPIAIAAIDAPPPADLRNAFTMLERGQMRAAIGPARDGGINFIAFVEPPVELLHTFTVRDGHTVDRCLRYFGRIYQSGITADVDRLHDLQRVALHEAPPIACIPSPLAPHSISRAPPVL